MAEGGSDRAEIDGQEELFEWKCKSCEDNNSLKEAICYCKNCDECLCSSCLHFHNRYNKTHKVIGVQKKADWGSPELTQDTGLECSDHPGQTISMFCGQHDDVCCPVCAVLKHSDCHRNKLSFIPQIAKGIATGEEVEAAMKSMNSQIASFSKLEKKYAAFKIKLNRSQEECTRSINHFHTELAKRLQALRESSLTEMEKKHSAKDKTNQEHIERCLELKQTLQDMKQQMQKNVRVNESLLFVNLKNCQKLLKKCSNFTTIFSAEKQYTLAFQQNRSLQHAIQTADSLGSCMNTKKVSVKKKIAVIASGASKVPATIETIAEDETCVICMDKIDNPRVLECGHTFCTDCIEQSLKFKPACPACGKKCVVLTGDQPDGTMTEAYAYPGLVGYESCRSIRIDYSFPAGKQEDHHPNPGKRYEGIQRSGFLPDNKEGNIVLEMLRVAFERKLVFTIGSSRTTGQEGVITWNDIHHKTNPNLHGKFGYPDPTYLERVKDELSAKGVTEKDIPEKKLAEIKRFKYNTFERFYPSLKAK